MKQEEPKNKLINPYIEKEINYQKSYEKDIENCIKQDLEGLEYLIEELSFNQKFLKSQEENKDNFAEEESIDAVKNEINEIEKLIKQIQTSINQYLLDKISVQVEIDELIELEKRFREILLNIKSENLN